MELSDGIDAVTLVRAGRQGGACCTTTVRRVGSIVWEGEAESECPATLVGRFDSTQFDQLAVFILEAGAFGWGSSSGLVLPGEDQLTLHTVDGDRRISSSDAVEPDDFGAITRLIDRLAEQAEWQSHA